MVVVRQPSPFRGACKSEEGLGVDAVPSGSYSSILLDANAIQLYCGHYIKSNTLVQCKIFDAMGCLVYERHTDFGAVPYTIQESQFEYPNQMAEIQSISTLEMVYRVLPGDRHD